MSKIFVVNRAQGAGWKAGVKHTEQDDWKAHAEMMDQMYDDGFVLFAGPLDTGAVRGDDDRARRFRGRRARRLAMIPGW